MRAFVTGGSGFVGRNLIRMLVDRGHDVLALVRSPRATATAREAGATPVAGDLHTTVALCDGMHGCDVVFHAAAYIDHWNYEREQWHVNVEGTRHVIEAARAVGVPRLVYLSAAAVISDGSPIVDADERHPIPDHPFGPYARSKAAAEQLVLSANGPTFATVAVRPPAVWGVGDTTFLEELVAAVQRRLFVWIDGGRYPYATCHVRNVCEGAILAAEAGRGGDAYFLTDGDPITFRRFVTDLLATQSVTPGRLTVPRPVAWWGALAAETLWSTLPLPGRPPVSRGLLAVVGGEITVRDTKARRELGYTAHVSREVGLTELRSLSKG